jgi:hypothetical protein
VLDREAKKKDTLQRKLSRQSLIIPVVVSPKNDRPELQIDRLFFSVTEDTEPFAFEGFSMTDIDDQDSISLVFVASTTEAQVMVCMN